MRSSVLRGVPVVAFFLLVGGYFGLPYVETSEWGGLLVTLVISYVGIVVSLPLGIILALGRRSKMPAIKLLSVIFIEAVRGVPLVVVLFMASFMLPLFVPPGTTFDKLLRALIGVALFASAYMAEVIRGGLQAIPKGQYEGADSLGLGYWQKMGFIVMPQALKLVIPGIVNTFIGMFKDTSLVLIISMFDLLGIVKQNLGDADLGHASDGEIRPRLCGAGVLDLLLRHVALLAIYGTPARHEPSQLVNGQRTGETSHEQSKCRQRRTAPRWRHVSTTDVAVQIIGMHKWYGDFHVLKDINLKVMRGERIVIAALRAPANRR
jgi:His/Glu/Gln/Arg/opine family amino acid ABC transporter permease subunit